MGEFLLHIPCCLHFYAGSNLTSFLCGEFLLNIPCWHVFYLGSFSYTSRADCLYVFFFSFFLSLTHPVLPSFLMRGVSLTHRVLSSLLCREFHPCWLHFYLGSFSYTSRGGFIFIRGVSLTHPMLTLFLCGGVSLTHPVLPLFMMLGVSLTHPVLSSFLCREFLLHIPY